MPQTLTDGVVGVPGAGIDVDGEDGLPPPPQVTTISAAARKDAMRVAPATSFTCP
jgi:hypothetical protein